MDKPKTIEVQNEKIYEFNSYEEACNYLNDIQNKKISKGENTNI